MPRKKSLISNNWITLVVLVLAPATILLAAWGFVKIRNQGSDGSLYRTLDTEVAWVGDDHRASLHFVGGEVTETGPRLRKSDADVLVCLDRSGSMGSTTEMSSSLARGISATARLCRLLGGAGARVGLMTFDHESQVVSVLTDDAEEILESARRVSSGGGTDIGSATLDALDAFRGDSIAAGRAKYIVVISDFGDADQAGGIAAIDSAEAFGVQAIGIGVGAFINQDYLFNVFSSPSKALLCVEPSDLDDVFNDLVASSGILSVYATDFQLVERFDPRDFEITEAVDEIPYLLHADLSTGYLDFYSQRLFGAVNTYNYQVSPRTIGVQRLALQAATGVMIDSVGSLTEVSSDLRPYVLVLSWWLLLLMWLPALIFLFLMISRATTRIYEPHPREPIRRDPELQTLPERVVPEMDPVPTLFIGLGGLGCQTLLHVKHVVSEWFEEPETVPFTYLGLDTARKDEPHPPFCDQVLQDDETLIFPDDDNLKGYAEEIHGQSPNSPDGITVWADVSELRGEGDSAVNVSGGVGGNRRLGRLAFLRAQGSEGSAIRRLGERVSDWATTHYRSGEHPVVIIAGSGYGGTSSGVVIDVARVVREGLRTAKLEDQDKRTELAVKKDLTEEESGILESPPVQDSAPVHLYLSYQGLNSSGKISANANAEALLLELERFQVGSLYDATTPEGPSIGSSGSQGVPRPLFDRIHMMEPDSTVAEMADSMFHYCERSLSSAMINSIDDAHWRIHAAQRGDGRMRVNLPTIATLRFPRGRIINRLLVRAVNELFASQLIGWQMTDEANGNAEIIFSTRSDISPEQVIAEWKEIRSRVGDDRLSPSHDHIAFYRLLMSISNDPNSKSSDFSSLPAADVIRTRFARDLTEWLSVDPLIDNGNATVVARVGKLGDLDRVLLLLSTNLKQAIESPVREGDTELDALRKIQGIIRSTTFSLEFWKRLLLRNDEPSPQGPLVRPDAGLAVYLGRREGELETQDEVLRTLTRRRVYLLGGDECAQKAQRETLYEEYLSKPLLSEAQLARLFQWRFDSGMRLVLEFGSGSSRFLTVKSTSGEGAAADGASSLWLALRKYVYSHRECRGIRQISLADACPENGPDMSRAVADARARQLHVLYSYPNVTEWPELAELESRLRHDIVGGIDYERALTNNPLMISVHYMAPDRLWCKDKADDQGGTDWLQRSANTETLGLPFVHLAEAHAANLCGVYAQAMHTLPGYFAAPCRTLAEHSGALTQAMCLDAQNHIQLTVDEALVRAWRLVINGKSYDLNRRGESGWLQALHQLIMTGRDAGGGELYPVLQEAEEGWSKMDAETKVAALKEYVQSGHEGQENDDIDDQARVMLKAVALVEMQVIMGDSYELL